MNVHVVLGEFSVAENPNNSLDTFPNNPGDALISSGGVTTLVVELGENFAIGGLGARVGGAASRQSGVSMYPSPRTV